MCRQVQLAELEELIGQQEAPFPHHAFKCPKCGHIQSYQSMVAIMSSEQSLSAAFQVCETAFLGEEGCACDLNESPAAAKLEILFPNGEVMPTFEPASPEEAQRLMAETLKTMRKCRVCGCSEFDPCPEGCFWVERDLCLACTPDSWEVL